MEKRTIGKFIAVLRKANGMTQKELGERLFVSDKTVSRWEQDESTPELALIPVIAEIFGITTDELLRGERNSPEMREEYTAVEELPHIKTLKKKQFANMLHKHTVKFRNMSMISIGIALLGLIAAIICDVGFTRAVIGFCVGMIFLIASAICQLCFTTSARLPIDEDESEDRIIACRAANSSFVGSTVGILMLDLALFGFLLPLAVFSLDGYTGIGFGGWMVYGLLFAAITLILGYLLYAFIIRGILIKSDLLYADDAELEKLKKNNRLLKKMLITAGSITLLLCIMISLVDPILMNFAVKVNVFDNHEEFQEFMRLGAISNTFVSPQIAVATETVPFPSYEPDDIPSYMGQREELYYYHEESGDYFPIATVTNEDGSVILEYVDDHTFYSKIEFNYKSEDLLPIKVITRADRQIACNTLSNIKALLTILIAVNIITCTVIYFKKSY